MAGELERWARIERGFIHADLQILGAGGRFISATGDDMTKSKIAELEARFEHVTKALREIDDA